MRTGHIQIEQLADPQVMPHAFTHNLRVDMLASARSKRFEKQILHDLATRHCGFGNAFGPQRRFCGTPQQ